MSPYNDIGLIPIVAYYFTSTTPLLLLTYFLYFSYQRCTGKTSLNQIRNDLKPHKEVEIKKNSFSVSSAKEYSEPMLFKSQRDE